MAAYQKEVTMNGIIEIIRNPNGDSRTAPKGIKFEQFREARDMHAGDVGAVMHELSRMMDRAGKNHDCTARSQERMFYRDFVDAQEHGTDLAEGEWYQIHIRAERHHLLSHCPDDVNLIDVIEMIADCVCAGLARSGEIRDMEISREILDKAVENTAGLIRSMVVVKQPSGLS